MKGALVATDTGRVQGYVTKGVHRFLGIPYAEPPFAQNRFKPAQPRTRWDGALDAGSYGLICPQTGGMGLGDLAEGEDCLNLNLWTPDPAARGLPVMVWAHGGGQVSGTGAAAVYDGTHFAEEGVVLITNNRRLGAEGYLYLQEDFGGGIGPGNLGILDQIEVLRWVQRNVEKFGGDPNNVTLFGESGGGAAAQAVVATPASAGLLRRVILQSGGHAAQRPHTARAVAQTVLKALDIKPGDTAALVGTHWSSFVSLYDQLQATDYGSPQIYLPVVSEKMPNHPVDASFAGLGADVEYLIGSCRQELNLFSLFGEDALAVFTKRRDTLLKASGVTLPALRAAYKSSFPELDDEDVDLAIAGDLWFRVPGQRIAEGHVQRGQARTYLYRFDWESQLLGAAHAMDLVLFGNGTPLPGLAGFASFDEVARKMRQSWINFATSGDPSIVGSRWPEYDLTRRISASLDSEFTLLEDPYRQPRQVLQPLTALNWTSANL
ncbi:MAG: carboxylesterase family protein [Pseudomonadota bacterium]